METVSIPALCHSVRRKWREPFSLVEHGEVVECLLEDGREGREETRLLCVVRVGVVEGVRVGVEGRAGAGEGITPPRRSCCSPEGRP